MIQEMVAIAQEDLPYLVLTEDPNLQAYRTDQLGDVERACPGRDRATCLRAGLLRAAAGARRRERAAPTTTTRRRRRRRSSSIGAWSFCGGVAFLSCGRAQAAGGGRAAGVRGVSDLA